MKAFTHITAGRTAIRALLVAVVLTAGIAGPVGTAAAEPMDGMGDDPYPPALYMSLDGKGNDPYPLALYSLDGKGNDPYFLALYSLDGKGNDVLTNAFPINNITATIDSSLGLLAFPIDNVTAVGFRALSIEPQPSASTDLPDVAFVALIWSQDMDPY